MHAISCTLLMLLPFAQTGDAAKDIVVLRSRSFILPLGWDPQFGATVEVARLFVSEDRGANWKRVSDHRPGDRRVPYKVDRDGEYWFALQLRLTNGAVEPAIGLIPSMKVRVLTEKSEPKIESTVKSVSPEGAATLAEMMQRKGYAAIELEKLRTGYLGVRVRIGDTKLFLLLDTGSPDSYADPQRTKAADVTWKYLDENAFGPGWGKVGFCAVSGMKIGDVEAAPFQFRSKDQAKLNDLLAEYGDPAVDGLLGADVLDLHAAVIDYSSRTLFLRPATKR
jgi:hypothetical protein